MNEQPKNHETEQAKIQQKILQSKTDFHEPVNAAIAGKDTLQFTCLLKDAEQVGLSSGIHENC